MRDCAGHHPLSPVTRRAVPINAFNSHADLIGPSAHYNPMTATNPKSPSFSADCDNIAESINPMVGKEPHWVNGAREVWSGTIQFVRKNFPPGDQNLGTVYSLIAGPLSIFKATVAEAIKTGDRAIIERLSRFDDLSADDREARSILSTAKTNGAFLSIEPIRKCLSSSDITAAELRQDPATTLYSITPPEYAHIGYAFNRLIVESTMRELMHEPHGDEVTFVIDEMPAMGRMEILETIMAMGAGLNIRTMCYCQDVHQLKALYPDTWMSFLANAGVQIWYAPREKETAEYLSSRCGQRTLLVKNTSTREISKKEKDGGFTGISYSYSPQSRALFLPQEIMAMRKDRQIMFVDGVENVIVAARRPYWEIAELQGRYDPNPYHS